MQDPQLDTVTITKNWLLKDQYVIDDNFVP